MKILILILVLLLTTCLYSTIINVPADQPTIQEGINVAVDADTVLVQPGTYVETIDYNGKNITVASLFLTTQDTTYISQTIIDGNQNGTVVSFENGETTSAVLTGFTITNGSGGGIGCVYTSYPRLENLVIIGNYAEYNGGGILCGAFASPSLENVTITDNSAGGSGGGIFCYNYCTPSLENVTISNNTSYYGGGIYCEENCSLNADNVTITNNSAIADGGGIFCVINSNLNLENVILTENTASDEGGGIYINESTPSLEYVTLSDNTALEGGGIYCEGSNPILENVIISGNSANEIGGGIFCAYSSSPSLINVTISDNSTLNVEAWGGGICCMTNSSPSLENVTISNNSGDVGGGILCMDNSSPSLKNVDITGNSAFIGGGINCNLNSNPDLINVLITGNSADEWGGGISCFEANPSLVNVTLSDNTANEGGGIWCRENSNPELIDCIFWNNSPEEIYFDLEGTPNTITISYSDIQGGEAGIVTNNNGTVNWLEGNIDEDPLFMGTGEYPFSIQDISPCIDAGIPDTIGLNLPPWDIIGNIRIWDGDGNGSAIIDMGAYEYGAPPYVDVDDNIIVQTPEVFLHQNYPNPFNPETTISYQLPENSKVELTVYNLKGQKVKTLISEVLTAGEHSIVWDGTDNNNKSTSSGIYFYKLKTANFEKTRKMILMK